MKRMLDDYSFDERLRYEAHTLHYMPDESMELQIGGIMGAAVLCALLVDTDEGDERGIAVDGKEQREAFFERYEREVRRDNGGLFTTEVDSLNQAYMELTGSEDTLLHICRNERLFDLAVGLIMDYMHRLVLEQVNDHIYELLPWHMPFAQWLFDAGYVETRRQHLLSINWLDAAAVYALAQKLEKQEEETLPPTFYFEGENAEQLMETYFRWLWADIQAQTEAMPDAKVQLAQLKPYVLQQETDLEFLRLELKKLEPDDLNLFRKWMKQWTDFITRKLQTPEEEAFPKTAKSPNLKQELFLDHVLSIPEENSYVAVREYIRERCKYDQAFHSYFSTRTLTQFCEQLTLLFGWYVNPNHLGKRLKITKK